MKKNLKLLISSAMIALTFSGTQIYSMQASDHYRYIGHQNQDLLIHNLDLKRSLVMDTNSALNTSFFQSVEWDNRRLLERKPNKSLLVERDFSSSEMEREIKKSTSLSVSASVSVGICGFGGSINTNYSTSTATQNRTSENNTYLLCTYDSPKIELTIQKQYITASQQIENAIRNVFNNQNSDLEKFKELVDIFKDYGVNFPTKFVIGGRIYWEETKKITSNMSAEQHAENFQLAARATLPFASASLGVSTSNGGSSLNKTTNEKYNTTMRFIGGSSGYPDDPSGWGKTLDRWTEWAVIERGEFYPIIDFLTPTLKTATYQLIHTYIPRKSIISYPLMCISYERAQKVVNPTAQYSSAHLEKILRQITKGDVLAYAKIIRIERLARDEHRSPKYAIHVGDIPSAVNISTSVYGRREMEISGTSFHPVKLFVSYMSQRPDPSPSIYCVWESMMQESYTLLKESTPYVTRKMKKYAALNGEPHPRWEEFKGL